MKTKFEQAREIINQIISVLNRAGETEFAEIKRRDKKKIFNLLYKEERSDTPRVRFNEECWNSNYALSVNAGDNKRIVLSFSYNAECNHWDAINYIEDLYVEIRDGLHEQYGEASIAILESALSTLSTFRFNEMVIIVDEIILDSTGSYHIESIDLRYAQELVVNSEVVSWINDKQNARLASSLLGVKIPQPSNRFNVSKSQIFLVFRAGLVSRFQILERNP